MNRYGLLFDSPPWLILLGLLLGLAYAGIMYYRMPQPWGRKIHYLLAFLRFMLVVQLTLLLFGPLIRQVRNVYEAPAVLLALDNSSSIAETTDSVEMANLLAELVQTAEQLEAKGFTPEIRTISGARWTGDLTELVFDHNRTDLHAFLRSIQNDYESRNLQTVVLLSDGLFNQGMNPLYSNYPFRIHTLGLGDTLQRPDINITALQYNKIAYLGNRFPLVAEVNCIALPGSVLRLSVSDASGLIEEKSIEITRPEQFFRVSFLLEADQPGMRRYRVEAAPVEGEYSDANNRRDAIIEVVEGREKILLAAPSPHPDLKAIRSALENNSNFEVITYIPGVLEAETQAWDAAILHQTADKAGRLRNLETELHQGEIPLLYVLGRQSDIAVFNGINGLVEVQMMADAWDTTFPWLNRTFSIFNLEDSDEESVEDYPPLRTPFAEFSLLGQVEVLLYQRIGNVRSSKPLMLLQRGSGRRSAAILGEGIWQWRLQEYAQREDQQTFDRFIVRTLQYLTARDDKRRFRVYPQRTEYFDHESVVFESEAYNEVFERIYGFNIDLVLRDEEDTEQSFSFFTSEANSQFRVGNLPVGLYTYEASTEIMGKPERTSGTFSVADLQLESARLHADHNLMRNLARQSGGSFHSWPSVAGLRESILADSPVSKIHSSEDFMAIIQMKWGLLILILFAAAEWFMRKYHGSY